MLAATITGSARERTDSELQAIAAAHFNTQAAVKAFDGQAVEQQQLRVVSATDAYAVYQPGNGDEYVILSKSDNTQPVIGYSNTPFPVNDIPEGLKWYLSTVETYINEAEKSGKRLITALDGKTDYDAVEPFITTLWHQGDPYNLKAPKKYPAGCVAISMAQSMNYCRYPSSANFRGYALYAAKQDTRYTVDSIDISSIYRYPYLDTYGRATAAQQRSVATLVRDCGYSVLMRYEEDGSGTYAYLAGMALVEIFGFPEQSVKFWRTNIYPDKDKWYDVIYTEMQRRCPVIYGGADKESGGHSFLICGMDANGLVYVNWGWGGDANGYYDISLMNPKDMEFSVAQDMVFGIRSQALATDHVEPRICTINGDAYTFSFTTETEENTGRLHPTLNVSFGSGICNYTPSTLDGDFGLFGTDLTTGRTWHVSCTDEARWGPGAAIELKTRQMLFYYYVDDELVPGHDYRISFGTRDRRENQWHSILCEGGEIGYDIHYTGQAETSTISEVKHALYDAIGEILYSQSSVIGYKQKGRYDINGRPASLGMRGIQIVDGRKVVIR